MKLAFVLDCSVTMSWCFGDESTVATEALLARLEEEAAIVPTHWLLEVTNVLAMAERRGRISADDSGRFLQSLDALEIQIDDASHRRAFDHLLPLCRAYGLTTYDACYLDVALRWQLPLASLDEPLRQAAAARGVPLLGL